MAELLKDRYDARFFDRFYADLQAVYPQVDVKGLDRDIHAEGWEALELKQRMRRIATVFRDYLPEVWDETVDVLLALTDHLIAHAKGLELEYFFLPDVVEQFGLDDVETSCRAMEKLTQYTTSEFAVRPFIDRDQPAMMDRMLAWSQHDHYGVRRWSSEGCRPRLPWGMALKALQQDPSPIIPILDNLKNDPSEFVRRSVANNLNDISKDHPLLVAELAQRWKGGSPETDAMLKHACRTLLKAGDPVALELFGFPRPDQIKLHDFQVRTPHVPWSGDVEFSFKVENIGPGAIMLRLEYGMHYLRGNESHSQKVFKISERELKSGEMLEVVRKQSFRPISTRRYYPGRHKVSLILNGRSMATEDFTLNPG